MSLFRRRMTFCFGALLPIIAGAPVASGSQVAPVQPTRYRMEVVDQGIYKHVQIKDIGTGENFEYTIDFDATDGEIYFSEHCIGDGWTLTCETIYNLDAREVYARIQSVSGDTDWQLVATGDTISIEDSFREMIEANAAGFKMLSRALDKFVSGGGKGVILQQAVPAPIGEQKAQISVFVVESCVWDYGPGALCSDCCNDNIPRPDANTDCSGAIDAFECCYMEACWDYCHRLCNSNPGSVIFGTIDIAACIIASPIKSIFGFLASSHQQPAVE